MNHRRLWWTGTLAAGVACLCFCAVLSARPGVVKTRDGRTIEGDVEEKPDQVIVTIRGIKTPVPRDQIEGQVEYYESLDARYQDKVAKLPAKPSADDHLALARWCYDVRLYDQALAEIEKARKLDPNNSDVATLEATVISQRRLDKAKPPAVGPGTTVKPPAGNPPPAAAEKGQFLAPEDINTIRQMEWRETDTVVPRVSVPAKVRREFLDAKALDAADFATRTPAQQAFIILRDGSAELRKDVKLTSDPQSLVEFRRTVQPLILNNCATAGCHGGHNAGRFFLYSTNPDREEVAYTNFYILQSYRQQFGEFEQLMIDRTYPDRSILAQFALSPEAAELDHPEIKGQAYKPIAANKSSDGFKRIVGWIKSLQATEPNYGISYTLPTSSPKKPDAPAPKVDTPKPDAAKDAPKPATPPPAGTGGGSGTGAPAKPATVDPTPTPPKTSSGSTNLNK